MVQRLWRSWVNISRAAWLDMEAKLITRDGDNNLHQRVEDRLFYWEGCLECAWRTQSMFMERNVDGD